MKKLNEEEKGYIEGSVGRKDLRTPQTSETPVDDRKDRLKSVSIAGFFEGGMRRENQDIAEDMDADESEKSNSNTCIPPSIETPVEGVDDYYYSEQSARHWHDMNHWDRVGYTLMKKNKVNGILYTERVTHGRKPTCKVTDAVLVASGIEGKDLMVEYTNVAW